MNNRKFWIDTDTASDDAVAILMALRWEDVQVEGISVVSGNVPTEQGSINARYTVELCDADTPVYEGVRQPLVRKPQHAQFFHGPDGLGGMNYPAPARPPAEPHAVTAIIEAFRAAPGELTLVTLGPLTNVAAALCIEPRLADWVAQCYVMGGTAGHVGNTTPAAEYNIWCDPEAAQLTFASGMNILMVGWELCLKEAILDEEDIAHVRSFGTPYADFSLDCNRTALQTSKDWLGMPGIPLPDPVTMAVALDPQVCTRRGKHHVAVSLDESLTRGMTVVDQFGVTEKEPNIEVCWKIDAPRWKETLYHTLRGK